MPRKPHRFVVAGLLSSLLAGVGAPLADGAPTFSPPAQPTPRVQPQLLAAPSKPQPARATPFVLDVGPREASLGGRTPVAVREQATPRPTLRALPEAPPAIRAKSVPALPAASAPTAKPTRDTTAQVTARPTAKPIPAPTVKPTPTAKPTPAATASPEPTASPKPNASPTPTATPTPKPAPQYEGSSRFWYPALGIDARWRWYGCDYGGDPSGLGPGVYRWGCGAYNNVYLMSHAWSTFKAVRDGYHSGAMKAGQPIWYADSKGKVSQWRVKWIKRVGIDHFNATAHEWASNDSATPIMTLQTCDGRNDQFRIVVRIVPND